MSFVDNAHTSKKSHTAFSTKLEYCTNMKTPIQGQILVLKWLIWRIILEQEFILEMKSKYYIG